jgi:poly-gamma-glutamate synthesis protein (capsule biosynthesis protein)
MQTTIRLAAAFILFALAAPPAGALDAPETNERTVTLAFTGDVLIHGAVATRAARYGTDSGAAYDFSPMFTEISGIISAADLAIAHLEVPLSPDSTRISSYPRFNAPAELAAAIAGAGYDGVSTASNHSMDQGGAGITGTLDVLDAAGLGHTGTARSAEEDAIAVLYELGWLTVGHLSYTYGLNGIPLPAGEPWRANVIDAEAIASDALGLRRAGADFIVLSIHWGNEYRQDPTSFQRQLAEQVLEETFVDLIVGHHAHVVQPVDQIGSKFVLYGLGNSVSNQNGRYHAGTKDGVIALVTLEEGDAGWEASSVALVPTLVEYPTYRILPTVTTGGDQLTAELAASRDRTVGVMTGLLPGIIVPESWTSSSTGTTPVRLRVTVTTPGPPPPCDTGVRIACFS